MRHLQGDPPESVLQASTTRRIPAQADGSAAPVPGAAAASCTIRVNTLDGSVIGQCLPRHRHQEFLKFLRHLDREFPGDTDLHLIVDNYRTHKHANVNAWLAKHPRFHLHFTPTSSSWLNLVERWFKELTDKAIRRGIFYSVPDLIAAIQQYLDAHNDDPKPFVWTASIDTILEKVARCKAVFETVH